MRYIFLLAFTLLFTACNPTAINPTSPTATSSSTSQTSIEEKIETTLPAGLPTTQQDTDVNDLKILDEDSIVGNYILKRGLFRNQELSEGYLVIEEIDVNNYGYYYVTIAGELTPETHTGIFFKKGGSFVQKVIEDSSKSEIRQGKNKYKMSIIDNIHIEQKDELLKLHINSTKKEKLIWQRDEDEIQKSQKMLKALQDAQHEYMKYYQEKCTETSTFCGDAAYTRVNE